ncbi:uncharacterized protein EI97DRAFT_468825 [Westerdykella ornata]|uniref:Secreted protein n=1 Tax=Westerdykella ornata TaxID=318751 RepID=A0A6A6JFF9_WESOR|nr:uncharacterized protein EI97DRAFT_468825 [Westerdykella ornata]KAF2274366.1 hypothetical protein EI97DRAFT_468825 [Westerdykella ornata]
MTQAAPCGSTLGIWCLCLVEMSAPHSCRPGSIAHRTPVKGQAAPAGVVSPPPVVTWMTYPSLNAKSLGRRLAHAPIVRNSSFAPAAVRMHLEPLPATPQMTNLSHA